MVVNPLAGTRTIPQIRQPQEAATPAPQVTPTDSFESGCCQGIVSWLERQWKAVKEWAADVAQTADTVANVAPSVGSLVAARELARFESWIYGTERVSAVDWLKDRTPRLFASNGSALLEILSPRLEDAVGLSLPGLLEVEENFYTALAPVRDDNGVKAVAPYIQALAAKPFRGPRARQPAFVFLGDQR